ncbi:uncharacterized protein LOC119672219 [Teleopsis dalmanni]|uniref:uncharacterized protein LOC119672219 n=1 Tax=Teleopsis dalmanni TaxID=139649 RepID=UPI0018CE78AD|nr:uncharacterized protein LOC119672219 [Teleopsis dalmanni]
MFKLKLSLELLMIVLVTVQTASISSSEEPNSKDSLEIDHYTLGSEVSNAMPIYFTQYRLTYDSAQTNIVLDINFPAETSDNSTEISSNPIITQIKLYLEGTAGFESQAYITDGGIGEQKVSVQIVASNTTILQYAVIAYGIAI